MGGIDWYKLSLVGAKEENPLATVLIAKGSDSVVILESSSSRSDIESVMSLIATNFHWIPVVSQNTQNQKAATRPPAVEMNFKKYSNTEQKYEIYYPENWVISDGVGADTGKKTFFLKSWDAGDSCLVKVGVAPENDAIFDFDRKMTESQALSNSSVVIDGTQATQYNFGSSDSAVKKEIWMVKSGTIYYFWMYYHIPSLQKIASSQDYQQHCAECLSAFSQMSTTFKVLK